VLTGAVAIKSGCRPAGYMVHANTTVRLTTY
jgi:hypothetical protein